MKRWILSLVLAASMALPAGASAGDTTVLHVAADKGYAGWTPLHMAAVAGHQQIILALIEYGGDEYEGDVKVKDTGWTPLHIAAARGHIEIVKLLIDAGAYINAKTDNGSTPLDLAVREGHKDVADLLRRHGAKLNSPR